MRRADWVARLWKKVREYRRTPFQYGRTDCCIFVAHCIDAMIDSKLASELRYGNRRGAAKLILEEGGIVAAISNRLGPAIEGRTARRGDVCQIGARTIGICVGTAVMVRTRDGVEPRPRDLIQRFWRVD